MAATPGVEQWRWGEKGAHLFTLTNGDLEVTLSNYGAALLSVKFPDRAGTQEEITLNYSHVPLHDHEAWAALRPPSYGVVCGRFANRIAKGQFELDGAQYKLAINNGPNSLHGGLVGFNKQLWQSEVSTTGVAVTFRLQSPDGDEGYPGNLAVSVTYEITADNELCISYSAQTDKATPINLTNHAYWNLSGDLNRPIYGHDIRMPSQFYLPVDNTQIPTGELTPVEGTPFDLTQGVTITADLLKSAGDWTPDGFDHCYVVEESYAYAAGAVELQQAYTAPQAPSGMKLAADVTEPLSGRRMIVFTDQPGIQLYTGNSLRDPYPPHCKHHGLCLETQGFPDAPNQPNFPNSILRPDAEYTHRTMHRFAHC